MKKILSAIGFFSGIGFLALGVLMVSGAFDNYGIMTSFGIFFMLVGIAVSCAFGIKYTESL
ncbi:MAG: hypothetical protein IJS65_00630 [Clostridia bacterium]|nr:hypothetical protein [Clostridia bacterium]